MWTRRAATILMGSGALAGLTRPGAAAAMKTQIVPFQTSPFPYEGKIPETGKPFLDTRDGDQPAHTSARGGIYPLDPTYSDRSVLLAVPPAFSLRHRAAIVVFLHGNAATLERDVVARQQIVEQFDGARLNAVLVAPQLAVDAIDSSAGHFWDPSGFTRFMAEAADRLAEMTGHAAASFARLPIVLVAFSGGHNPVAWILKRGELQRRIVGIVLLDALFDYEDVFAKWIVRGHSRHFFFSAYTKVAAARNRTLQDDLRNRGIAFDDTLPARLAPGAVGFLDAGESVEHVEFMTHAWVEDPLRVVLARVAL